MFHEVEIIIDVVGSTASGKTSVGVIIEKALRDAGFNVMPFENHDGDAEFKRKCLEDGTLVDNIKKANSTFSVTIHETPLPRGLY